jgi:uncharacterized protein (DUF433 family)
MAWYHEYIEYQAGVCGGYPILKGTRTPARAIIGLLHSRTATG